MRRMKFYYIKDLQAGPFYTTSSREVETPGLEMESLLLGAVSAEEEVVIWDADSSHKGTESSFQVSSKARSFFVVPSESFEPGEGFDVDSVYIATDLAVIYANKGEAKPEVVDYVPHIRDKSRLADKIIITGFTDPDIEPVAAEKLALARANEVKATLENELSDDISYFIASRPLSYFGKTDDDCRRVEVAALYLPHLTKRDKRPLSHFGFKRQLVGER